MARDILRLVHGAMAGLAISMTAGYLAASYVIADLAPVKSWHPRAAKDPPVFVDDNWPAPRYDDPLGTRIMAPVE